MKSPRVGLLSLCLAAAVLAVAFLTGVPGCSLPDTPATQAKAATLTKSKSDADKAAADATAQATALQAQIDSLRAQLPEAAKAGGPAYQALLAQNQALAAQLDRAIALHDQNAAIAGDSQKQLDALAAQTARNEAAWQTTINGLNAGAGVAGGAGSVPSPLSPALLIVSAILGIVGVAAGKIHSALVTTPAAVKDVRADAKADASQALAAVQSSNNMVASGAGQLQIVNHDATLAAGLTPGALELWDKTPDSLALHPTIAVVAKAAA